MKHQSIFSVYVVAPWTIRNGTMIGPVIAIREGVLCGSRGCILHSGHVLEENQHKFDGIPVSINHPVVNGKYVSIDHNADTKSTIVGVLKNSKYDPSIRGIRGEIHVPANHPRASEIQSIREVSMGVFSDEVYEGGEFNGQEYSACSISYEPDHLSLLSGGQIGACDFSAGCGIRTNSQSKAFQEAVREVAKNHFQTLIRRKIMNTNEIKPLLPPGVKKEESQSGKWDGPGVEPLLPPEFNRSVENEKQTWTGADEVQPLMPIFNR
jgi:hypothetical protein